MPEKAGAVVVGHTDIADNGVFDLLVVVMKTSVLVQTCRDVECRGVVMTHRDAKRLFTMAIEAIDEVTGGDSDQP